MKKYIILLIVGLIHNIGQSQDINDALRYSQTNLNGTARFRAMSGAFGALGGDLSSLNVNPAGSSVFSNNQMGVTLSSLNVKNDSDYYGTLTSEKNNNIVLNQAGAVFVFKNQDPNNNWKKAAIGINYENTNNFNNSIFSAGTNPTTSVANYFLYYANGVRLNTLENSNYENLDSGEQQAFLGYQGYIINPDSNDSNNTSYNSNVASGGNYYQENSVISSGYNGKVSFNASTSYKNKIFLGLNFNTHFTDFTQNTIFYEDNNNNLGSDYKVTALQFSNNLYTYGNGFSFQLGGILKATEEIRLGLAYESPTWYTLNDEFTQKLSAISSNSSESLPQDNVNPNYTNIYQPYRLQTPGKTTFSGAYIFGKQGLISIDYAIKDYSNIKFKPENDSYYRSLNSTITNTLNNTSELRIGAEYKIEAFSLRGGYRMEQSPYKDKALMGDLKGYSAGIGYNFGGTKLDLSYAYAKRDSQQGYFSQGFTDGAKINAINNSVSLTLLFEL